MCIRDRAYAVQIDNPYIVTLCAFICGSASTVVIVAISRLRRDLGPGALVLAGVALSSLFTGGSTLLQYFACLLYTSDMNPNDIIFCESVEILSYVVASGFASAVLVDTPGIRVSGVEYIPVEGTETVSYGAAYMAEEMTELLRRFLEIFASMSK